MQADEALSAGEPIVVWDMTGSSAGSATPAGHANHGLVTSNQDDTEGSSWRIIVDDVAAALRTYAAWCRKRFAGEVIAVVGPIGKSTTRRMIEHLAEAKFPAGAIAGQRNIAQQQFKVTPYDALLVLTDLTDQAVGIVECSCTEDLRACDPTIAVLTSHPTPAGFGRELVASQAVMNELSPRTKVILPGNIRLDDEARVAVSEITTYGREAECDIPLRQVTCGRGMLSFFIKETRFQVPVWGRHHAPAAAAAIAVARLWDVSFLEIVTKLAKFSSQAEGCSVFHHANMTFINDTRHGGRDSLRSALEMLREVSASKTADGSRTTSGRRVVVCESLTDGDQDRSEVSRRFGEQVISIGGADLLHAIGQDADLVVQAACESGMPAAAARVHINNTHTHDKSSGVAKTDEWAREFAAELVETLQPGDTVLFKSGPTGQLHRVIAAIKHENKFMPLESPALGSVLPTVSVV